MNRTYPAPMLPVSRFHLLAWFCATLMPAAAQSPAPGPVSKESLKLYVARNGTEVMLSWELPSEQVRLVEIYRNNQVDVEGRNRFATVRPLPAGALDTVADGAPYWYWLKVIFKDGQTLNVGPAITPSAQVWTP